MDFYKYANLVEIGLGENDIGFAYAAHKDKQFYARQSYRDSGAGRRFPSMLWIEKISGPIAATWTCHWNGPYGHETT
jgi:hypothetical protein